MTKQKKSNGPSIRSDISYLAIIYRNLVQMQDNFRRANTTDFRVIASDSLYTTSFMQHLQVIGEVGHKLSDSTKTALICIDFSKLYKTRNHISHSYDTLDFESELRTAYELCQQKNVNAVLARLDYCKAVYKSRQLQAKAKQSNK